MSKYWIDRLGGPDKAQPRGDRGPGARAKIDRKPLHGVGNEYGDAEPVHDNADTIPVHRPRDDDDSEVTQ